MSGKTFTTIPSDTLEAQALASNPANSVWVSAHAGSGKTHVLSQRVVRLLLSGTDPSRILCLTYTRAAAANMANRIFRDLGRWTMLDDEALAKEIAAIEGRPANALLCRRARRLFAQALETPGGLKIQTIHAFCEALLHQFPLEANIAGHFELLEGQAAEALLAQARRTLLIGTTGDGDRELAEAFALVLQRGGEFGLNQLLDEIVMKRDDLTAAITDLHGFDFGAEHGFAEGETAQTILAEIWPDAYFDAARADDIEAASDKKQSTSFAHDLRAICHHHGADTLTALTRMFLTGAGEPRKPSGVANKEVSARFPELADEFVRMAEALVACRSRIALLNMVAATKAALVIADRLIGNYTRLKQAGGYLDFEDLIRRTIALLARTDAGPWVRFRLDQGIDHILVDEAQDTSPQQWAVIRHLSDEFFAGEGARAADLHRTIFAVGDEKQSIYSFQGAEPESFDWNRQTFKHDVEAAQRPFETVKLRHSFRSTEDVLSAVDLVFSTPDRRAGLTQDGTAFAHAAIRNAPGSVEAWSFIGTTTVEEPDDWTQAIDHASAPAVLLAQKIAERLQGWLRSGEMLAGKGRPIRPGDVMVLVRKRDSFIHALSRELKNRHIAVAGADRLSLPGHIAVKDLVALGRVVLQPEDDLSLAALLKSPIFGLTEDALFELAHGRGEAVSLYTSLRRAAPDDLILHAVLTQLDAWRNEAGFKPAFEFYAGVLGRDGVRQKMISRLGHEAGEILDEFLNFVLGAERAGPPDLETVLSLLDQAGPDIKREMDQTRDEVRIMTVHAAKGLEAPIVFLVDSGGDPFSSSHLPRLLGYETRERRKRFLWRAGKDLNNEFTKAIEAGLKQKAENEYRRLLYVGMTRAEDRLIACGYHGKRPPNALTWLSMVQEGLLGSPATVASEDGTGRVLRYQVSGEGAVPPERERAPDADLPAMPAFLRDRKAPASVRLPRPLAPSRASALIEPEARDAPSPRSPVLDPDLEPSFAIARGTAIHRLLQILPDLPAEEREPAAERYLARTGAGWTDAERAAAHGSVLAVLDDARFAPLFAEGSRAEVAVMGTLDIAGTPRAIAGTIDRLAVTAESVLILDYKTNRPPPADLASVPPAYVVQLALYRALLADLYPGRRIEAALLFTEAPRLIALPTEAMDAALARLSAG